MLAYEFIDRALKEDGIVNNETIIGTISTHCIAFGTTPIHTFSGVQSGG
jgi:hypothetical protein